MIFKLFKDQYPEKKIGIFLSWTDNRTKLAGEKRQETNQLQFDYVADGFELDSLLVPHDTAGMYMHHIDDRVIDRAVACIKKECAGPVVDISGIY